VPDDLDRPAPAPTAPLPSPGSPPGSRAERRQHRRRRLIVLAGVATVVVIGGAVAAAVALSGGGGTAHRASTAARRTAASSTLPTTLTTAPTSTSVIPRSSNPVVALAQQYDGLYVGTYTNTTFNTTGNASLEVRIDPSAGTLRIALDLTGDLFGGGAKAVRHTDGVIKLSDPNAPIAFQTGSFGMVTGKLSGLSLSLTAPNVPDPKVQTFELDGSLRSDLKGFDATFKVGFRNGQTAQGTASVLCAVTGQRPSEVRTLCSP